ncbi:class I SAM-dependent methyltransferase [Algicella marina]|uniref:Methyltransferase domain-containing protein n=1 Tax=Algicella marina TaxID=2683284 RepID=A0A6P1SYZ8_9RHOB|nr:class I SAM-dependent methyltransferase [Algicella marina]QHQ35914.1 methyltransferase domain-containing protein [Algicella marina]
MDIIGTALLEYHNGERNRRLMIHRDDGFCEPLPPAAFFADAPLPHEADILGSPTGPVLDIGCGAGRHLLWLRERGIAATGLDVSSGALETCRLRGCRDVLRADVLAPGALHGLGPFATILLFGQNIGLGVTPRGVGALLRTLAPLLTPEGRIVFTSVDTRLRKQIAHVTYRQANVAAGRPPGHNRFRLEYDGTFGPWFDWLYLGPEKAAKLAATCGFQATRTVRWQPETYAMELRRV